jgi:hypothetical protein
MGTLRPLSSASIQSGQRVGGQYLSREKIEEGYGRLDSLEAWAREASVWKN